LERLIFAAGPRDWEPFLIDDSMHLPRRSRGFLFCWRSRRHGPRLVGLRFVSEDQPLGCQFVIKTLIFGVRHSQGPLKTLRSLGAKVLWLGLGLHWRMHRASVRRCGPKKPQSDSDNPRLGCWGRWVPVAHVVGTTRFRGVGAAIGTRLSLGNCPYSNPIFVSRPTRVRALPHN